MIKLTRAECRHLVNMLVDYVIKNPDSHVEVSVDLIEMSKVETSELIEKLILEAASFEKEDLDEL